MKQFFNGLTAALVLLAMLITSMPVFAAEAEAKEFRAVWVSTVYGLDYPSAPTTDAAALKRQADSILDHSKTMGMTAVILQVRPASDAFYPSGLFPWSKYLTGAQGKAPSGGFDPLAYWVEQAHARGLELHAWLNPYRVANDKGEFDAMTATHPAKEHPDWVVAHTDGKYYFNPGIPEVRQLVVDGAEEIAANYRVDGIHIDDYFYPDASFDDQDTFETYGDGFASRDDWRRSNIDRLVQDMARAVKRHGDIQFGVSPAGIWANQSSLAGGSATGGNETYFSHFADTKKWVEEEWIDYICPQIYWYIGHSAADYRTLVRWWADTVRGTGVKLYIGMGDYQAGNSNPSSPWYGIDPIRDQIELNKTIPEITGEVHFRYQFLVDNDELYRYYAGEYGDGVPEDSSQDVQQAAPSPSVAAGPILDRKNHSPYIVGMDGKFYPERSLTRAEAATLFSRLMVDGSGNPMFHQGQSYPALFSDVPSNQWYASPVQFMAHYDILRGYEDGTFHPAQQITRAEFTALVSRFDPMATEVKNPFGDVDRNYWAVSYISNAVQKGYLTGYEDGTFRPAQPITRSEAVKVINRLLGRQPDRAAINKLHAPFPDLSKTHWAYYEVMEATQFHYYKRDGEAETWTDKPPVPSPTPTPTQKPPASAKPTSTPKPTPDMPKFESDTIKFIIPELKLNGELSPLDLTRIDSIALHHMAHPTADFEEVQRWHLEQDWITIGYNFWIDFNGNVYVGRGWNLGAGVANQNGHIISIGFQGDYDGVNKKMPFAQFKAGAELVHWIQTQVPTATTVGGHKDFGPSECPGQYFPLEDMIEAAEKLDE